MRKLRRNHEKYLRKQTKHRRKSGQRAAIAGAVAAIALGAGMTRNYAFAAYNPDQHELPVAQDYDTDLLSDEEERAIGYHLFDPDQNDSGIPDGVELAKRCAAVINQLPQYEEGITEICRRDWYCYGLESCDVCGEIVNMCHIEIVNPPLGLSIEVPFLSLHYVEYGSFSCAGSVHNERFDVPSLLSVLELRFPYEPNEHQLPLDYVVESVGRLAPDANDIDDDLLADSEELAAGYNTNDPDEDNNLTPDGIDLAKRCREAVYELPEYGYPDNPVPFGIQEPYKVLHRTRGLETCEVCGLTIAMDYWEVVNPRRGYLAIEHLPVMAAHYMEHGSFSYAATVHNGRVDVPLLLNILEISRSCQTCMGDMTGDGWLSPADLSGMVNTLLPHASSHYTIKAPAGSCGDMNGDRWLSPVDVSNLVNSLLPYKSNSYWVECP